jgi:putative ABC transport system substrate-binding protein
VTAFIGRRQFIFILLGGSAAAWPLAARAQQGERVRRIGVLTGYAESDLEAQARLDIFRQSLQQLGWTIGRNLLVDARWSRGDPDRARSLAKELVELQPDVILGETTSSVRALQQTTGAIPIVFTNLSNPLGSGFVASMARPGGNITGFTNFESSMGGKWLEVLKEVVPRVSRAAIMFNPTVSTHITKGYYLGSLEDAARRLMVEQIPTPVKANDIENAIYTLARKSDGALLVLPDTFTLVHRDLILRLTALNRVAAIYSFRLFAQSGGLMSYGINATDQFPRAADYVNRILKGEKPADLPVQAPTKYELVINLKTAKALGLDVPPSLLARADEVIE